MAIAALRRESDFTPSKTGGTDENLCLRWMSETVTAR